MKLERGMFATRLKACFTGNRLPFMSTKFLFKGPGAIPARTSSTLCIVTEILFPPTVNEAKRTPITVIAITITTQIIFVKWLRKDSESLFSIWQEG
jgi:hypothetical protein